MADERDDDDLEGELDDMADAVEAERGAEGEPAARPALPRVLILPALVLAGASAAPVHPDGFSFLQLLYAAFLRSPLDGLVMLVGFGAPFCFGALVAAAAWVDGRRGAGESAGQAILRRALVVNLSLLHAQLLLVAVVLVRAGQGMVPLALLGFAVVSGGYFTFHHARSTAEGGEGLDRGAGPSTRWLVRWGATVVVAICGWVRLQMLIDVQLGWAIEVVLASCMAIAVLVMRPRN